MLVDRIYESTQKFLNSVSKSKRKEIGQFFTPPSVARFMGSLMKYEKEHIDVLDAGAGSGILSASIMEEILYNHKIKSVYLCLYENNDAVLPVLQTNMSFIKETLQNQGIIFNYEIKSKNFIWDNIPFWRGEIGTNAALFDVIISNPPYKKINKDDLESKYMPEVVYGQPNIYFLFMAMSAKLLKQDGQMIFINPRSFSSGSYFHKFRKWFFDNIKLTNIHSFISREDVFNNDNILQETIIIKAIKTDIPVKYIKVTKTEGTEDFYNISGFNVPYSTILNPDDKNNFMLIPTSEEDIEVINFIHSWKENLIDLGYRLKTGPVVDFRSAEFLRKVQEPYTVPLFWAYNFENFRIKFPVSDEKKPQYIINSETSKRLLIKNKNYLYLKRFTSKEEKRRLQPVVYLAKHFPEYELIGVENHLNYITKTTGIMTEKELLGLFVIINSSVLDKYFRILNGSTQVNANEINSIPFPSKEDILELGAMIINKGDLSVESCDMILESKYKKHQMLKAI